MEQLRIKRLLSLIFQTIDPENENPEKGKEARDEIRAMGHNPDELVTLLQMELKREAERRKKAK